MSGTIRSVLIVVALVTLSGCMAVTEYGSVGTALLPSSYAPLPGVTRVAVVIEPTPFRAQFGEATRDAVERSLAIRGFRVVDAKAVSQALQALDLSAADLGTQADVAAIGQFLSTEAIVTASIKEATRYEDSGTWPFRISPPAPSVRAWISMRAVRVNDGEMLWADSLNEASPERDLSDHVRTTTMKLMDRGFRFRADVAIADSPSTRPIDSDVTPRGRPCLQIPPPYVEIDAPRPSPTPSQLPRANVLVIRIRLREVGAARVQSLAPRGGAGPESSHVLITAFGTDDDQAGPNYYRALTETDVTRLNDDHSLDIRLSDFLENGGAEVPSLPSCTGGALAVSLVLRVELPNPSGEMQPAFLHAFGVFGTQDGTHFVNLLRNPR